MMAPDSTLPPPPPEAVAHSPQLAEFIASTIQDEGDWIPFSRFMVGADLECNRAMVRPQIAQTSIFDEVRHCGEECVCRKGVFFNAAAKGEIWSRSQP